MKSSNNKIIISSIKIEPSEIFDYKNKNEDDTKIIQKQTDKIKSESLFFIVNLLLSCFFFSPLVIFHWASIWDLIYLYIFPNDFFLSLLSTFLASNLILILCHLFQNDLNSYHQKLNKINKCYYGKDFLMRCFYTYVLTIAYVCSWKTYWDSYVHFTQDIHWIYFLIISFSTLIIYVAILKRSLDNFTKTVPFYLKKDTCFDDYFSQSKNFFYKNKLFEAFVNFVYFDVFEMVISTLIWRGIWDFLDRSVELFDSTDSNNILYSCILTGLCGYLILMILLLIDHCLFNCKKLGRYFEEIFLLITYLTISTIWRSYWTAYDNLVLEKSGDSIFICLIGSHFISLLVLSFSKCISSLYGISGSKLIDKKNQKNNGDEIMSSTSYLDKSNNKEKRICFEIKYL